MDRFSITTPIFYVNARPHIGHAYTVVAADVLARFHKQQGRDVFFLTGTDEHGAKIAEAAAAAGKPPKEFADDIAGEYQKAWKALDIEYDDFIRTTESRHEQGVRKALSVLHEKGVLYEKSYKGLYCTGCEKFLTEKDLDAEGKCPLHNRVPEVVEEKNWFFKLLGVRDEIKHTIEKDQLHIRPVERKNEVLGLFKQGLEDFSISRPKERVPWGIPLPFDESQTCYVWVDALLNYVTALGYGSEDTTKLGKYWPADLQIIGQDILKFHAVYWPAILSVLGLPFPKEIFVHGFFTVNGQKISKSLGNAIDPVGLVKKYGSDATRYLLLSQFPLGASGDISLTRLDEQYDAVLANTFGNLVSRTLTLLQKFSNGRIPDAPLNRSVENEIEEYTLILRDVWGDELLEDMEKIIHNPFHLSSSLNKLVDISAPWRESDAEKKNIALRSLAAGVAQVSILVGPLLPNTAAAIQKAFGVVNRKLPSPGAQVVMTNPSILFPRTKDLSRTT